MSLRPFSHFAHVKECRAEPVSIAEFRNPRNREILERWRTLAGQGRLPGYEHFKPETMWEVLGNLLIADVESREPPVFRFRLYGTKISRATGFDMTRKTVGELSSGALRDMTQTDYVAMLAEPKPMTHRVTIRNGGADRTYGRMLLPLAEDGRTVDAIFGSLELWDF